MSYNINLKEGTQEKVEEEECYTKCVVQLKLIFLVKQVISKNFQVLTTEVLISLIIPKHVQMLSEPIEESYIFAKSFNQKVERRYSLWKNGFMANNDNIPALLLQEREGLCVYIQILLKIYTDSPSKEKRSKLFQYLEIINF